MRAGENCHASIRPIQD